MAGWLMGDGWMDGWMDRWMDNAWMGGSLMDERTGRDGAGIDHMCPNLWLDAMLGAPSQDHFREQWPLL